MTEPSRKLLSKTEIRRALLRYRYDPEWERPASPTGGTVSMRKTRAKARAAAGNPKRPVGKNLTRKTQGFEVAQRQFPTTVLAALARVDRMTLGMAMLYGRMSDALHARLSDLVRNIESGHVVTVLGPSRPGEPRWGVEYHSPPQCRPSAQDKITQAEDWREWGRCRNCAGDRWAPLVLRNRLAYACRACVPMEHWRAMGAREPTAAEKQQHVYDQSNVALP